MISASLLEYVERNDVDGARRLLVGIEEQDRRSIVAKRGNASPPLFVAATRGHVGMVKFLAQECHADLNELGSYFFANQEYESSQITALSHAASSGDLEMVCLLINLGADINAVSNTGRTPVLEACYANAKVAEYLVQNGADVKKPDKNGETCLMTAARLNKELCQILIDNGAEVNAQNAKGNSALHSAITGWNSFEKADIVQILIDNGSDPYMTNEDGEDAFQIASLGGKDLILEKTDCQVPSISGTKDRVLRTARSILCPASFFQQRESIAFLEKIIANAKYEFTLRCEHFATKSGLHIFARCALCGRVRNALS